MAETTLPPWTPTQERIGSIAIRWMTRINKWLYRGTGGKIGGKFSHGAPICLVTTVGRKSGEPRTVALLYLQDGEDVVLVASKGGMSHNPMWYSNISANPAVEIEIGRTRRAMRAHQASSEEKAALWPKLVAMYPDYAQYQQRTTRDIPVIICSPVRAGSS
jgi:deazaflavin-dependent oxidoreductase (nitroreductase family)